ncbi:MAG: (Fe-S)-binding protein [Kineosporiaceae bacterium]|jgi:Fe-S oxidoreductase
MPLPTSTVIGMLSDNLRLRGSVLPLGKRRTSSWADGLNIPEGGHTVLYTGLTYQLMPYLESLSAAQNKLGAAMPERLAALGRPVNRLVNIAGLMAWPSREKRRHYDRILGDIVAVLRSAGVEFGYLYGDDLYSGALVHDYGEDEVVRIHGRRIRDVLRAAGVQEVITIDPHTTNMLRSVLPQLVDGFTVQVRHYLEVLADRNPLPRRDLGQELAVHDSCLMARAENVVEAPRALLRAAGSVVLDPEHARDITWCCGGPVESLYPEKAHANARTRVAQLRGTAPEAVTMCPICLVNLRGAANGSMRLQDISHYLRRAYT